MGYKKEDYRKFLNGELTESFMESEMVKDYLKALNIKKQTRIQQASAKLLNVFVKALLWC